jgi:hypothetical protein
MSNGAYSDARRATAWPPQMVLSMDTPQHVIQLLYLRTAWGLRTATEPPHLDPEPGRSAPPSSMSPEEWARRWDIQWALAWDWYRTAQRDVKLGDVTPQRLRDLDRSSLDPVFAPTWLSRHGNDGFDHDAYRAWHHRVTFTPHGRLLDHRPLDQSMRAVTAAWRTGLDTILILPYAGKYAERITARHLVVSDTSWQTIACREHALALPIAGSTGDAPTDGGE